MDAQQRRIEIIDEIKAKTGIDEVMISSLIKRFYAKIHADRMLGPIFESRIQNWEHHLHQMEVFWSSVALMSGRYHGNPMQKHISLPIDANHFDRWLEMFTETVHEICPTEAASHFLERANRIAQSFELGIAEKHGVLLHDGQRFLHART